MADVKRDDKRRPFAVSVRRPSELPPGADYLDELGGDPECGPNARFISTQEQDEEARKERLGTPPIQKPVITGEDRDRLVRECADPVLAQVPLIRGAGDVLVRRLSEVLGVTVDEADALVARGIAQQSKPLTMTAAA